MTINQETAAVPISDRWVNASIRRTAGKDTGSRAVVTAMHICRGTATGTTASGGASDSRDTDSCDNGRQPNRIVLIAGLAGDRDRLHRLHGPRGAGSVCSDPSLILATEFAARSRP